MKKLSSTQQATMDYIKYKIEKGRECGEYAEKQPIIKLLRCNSKTLLVLQRLGYIEILELSTNQHVGIDKIKVLNY